MKFAYAVEVHAATESSADIALRTALGRMSQEWVARSEPRLEIGDVAYADALRRNLAVSNAPEGASDADKLLVLADLFDAVDHDMGVVGKTSVQDDLRRIAQGLNHPYGE